MNRVAIKLIELLITPLGWWLRGKRPGEQKSYQYHPKLFSTNHFELNSPAFKNGEKMPERYTKLGKGENISPELRWSVPPKETKQLFLVMEDIDVPSDKPGIHVVAFLKPMVTTLPEGKMISSNTDIIFIPDKKGRLGYQGPRPLPGHGVHRYRFHLFALNDIIPTNQKYSNFEELLPLVDGHVIASAHLEGTQVG